MAYIRSSREELTGYQEHAPFQPSIDLRCDFVMVYGIGNHMAERIRQYREQGYTVHLMTGIAWGEYQDYLDGEWDGSPHWDEGQRERDGTEVNHGPRVPYMCPTPSFTEYLTEKLKAAVDCGVEAIHVEEPEYWARSGYSEAFRREYESRYDEPWRPQHESPDAAFRCARLKVELYCRAVGHISRVLKEYALERYGKELRFYVPTHSLINYTMWKILSPEAELLEIPTVDGYIAQVWTGTSRVGNVFEGIFRERTFETAFLEYGAMQELVRGTRRRMWFLNDPIEDDPKYTWKNYELNYRKTLTAALLQPGVWHFEICPWPRRVFEGKYPAQENDSRPGPIPDSYATMLCNTFQMLGDMDQEEWEFEGSADGVGIFLSDSALYQRSFPDGIVKEAAVQTRLSTVLCKNTDSPGFNREASLELMREIDGDRDMELDFVQSSAFPQFYGLAMPLLKYGLAIRPVQLENLKRFPGYLEGMRLLILSYEFIKPSSPDIHRILADWIRAGGELIYVGDGSDPFHRVRSWWQEAGFLNASEHLLRLCGIAGDAEEGCYAVGNGKVTILRQSPYRFCLTKEKADAWRGTVHEALHRAGIAWEDRNDLTLRRGPYVISAVMDESVSAEPKTFTGLFADMLSTDFSILHKKEIRPDGSAVLFDFSRIGKESFRVIGSSARIEEAVFHGSSFRIRLRAADRIHCYARIRMPGKAGGLRAADGDGKPVRIRAEWDGETRTLLLGYQSTGKAILVTGKVM